MKLKGESKALIKDIAEGITSLSEKLQQLKDLIEESLQGEVPLIVKETETLIKEIHSMINDTNSMIHTLAQDISAVKAFLTSDKPKTAS